MFEGAIIFTTTLIIFSMILGYNQDFDEKSLKKERTISIERIQELKKINNDMQI